MNETEIDSLAQEFLDAHEVTRLPVDPSDLARKERIYLLPGSYDGCFDARLEYRRTAGKGRFFLLYATDEFVYRPQPRVRFSLAHELGHFYLPQHRQALLSGKYHNSRTDFISEKPLEREADYFAAALLMPERRFCDEVTMKSGGFCTLKNLLELADKFQTSLTSTAIRYTKLSFEPCCVILSQNQKVKCSWTSQNMQTLGLGWIEWGSAVPRTSVTARLLGCQTEYGKWEEGAVDADVWFEDRQSRRAWEEAVVLGRTGLTLTFLATEVDDDGDD